MSSGERFRCLEVVHLQWATSTDPDHCECAILHEIWPEGGLFQVDEAAAQDAPVLLALPHGEVRGIVRSCTPEEGGYIITVDVTSGEDWLGGRYHPEDLLPCDDDSDPGLILPIAS